MASSSRFIAIALVLVLASSLAYSSSCSATPKTFPSEEKIYSADGVISKDEGSASAWIYLQEGASRRDYLVFQTDDSRIALFFDTFYSSGIGVEIQRVGARAGGNRRAIDSDYATGNFPEASIIIDNDGRLSDYRYAWYSPVKFTEGEWHLVAMKWSGSPSGTVSIYFDGALVGSKPYSAKYDDGSEQFSLFSVAYRPKDWRGESTAGGMLVPATEMRLLEGGIAVESLSFYPCALDDNEILALAGTGKPSANPFSGQTQTDEYVQFPPAPPSDYGAQNRQEASGSAVQAKQRVVSSTEFYSNGKKYLNFTSIRTVHIFFGLIPIDVEVQSKVDAETNTTVEQNLPWWYFIVAD